MASMFLMGSIGVAVANVLLAGALLALYAGVYGRTKAPFSIALLVFASAFLAHNALVVYSYVTMMPLIDDGLAPYMFGIGIFEAAGLGAMLWTATR